MTTDPVTSCAVDRDHLLQQREKLRELLCLVSNALKEIDQLLEKLP
jgi:hypothetical protein